MRSCFSTLGCRSRSSGGEPLPDRFPYHGVCWSGGLIQTVRTSDLAASSAISTSGLLHSATAVETVPSLLWRYRKLGYGNVATLKGGFYGWIGAGMPIIDAPDGPSTRI